MNIIRVAAWLIGIAAAIALIFTPISEASLYLAAILALCFVVVTWPSGSPDASPYTEARRWDELDPTAHLSTLDRLDGVGTRTTNQEFGS